jgi:Lrp/AsnC family transcriptional regulator, regulator for asnA, asnC and gidA
LKEKKIDELDRKIIALLLKDSKIPYATMADLLKVATGTVHQRVEKLKEAKIIIGSKILLDYKKFGVDVCTFIGINLANAKDLNMVLKNLEMFDEILEVHYTTGNYSLFIKVMTPTIDDLHKFLINKLQKLKEIQSTETFISLDSPINRDLVP